jgi:hypothetical protein
MRKTRDLIPNSRPSFANPPRNKVNYLQEPGGRRLAKRRQGQCHRRARSLPNQSRIRCDGRSEPAAHSKGPKVVWALEALVQTKDEEGRVGRHERLVIIRTVDQEPRCWYTLSNAPREVPLAKLVEVHSRRHGIEELFAAGKGEVGLDHYEVRSWVGWHHHMTLSLLALWFLQLERNRLGGKTPAMTVPQMREVFARLLHAETSERGADRRGSQSRAATQRRVAHLPLAC